MCIAFALGCSLWLLLAIRAGTVGWDFPPFYVAGRVPMASLYDQPVFRDYGKKALGGTPVDYYPPYVRPAIFAVPLRGLALLPFWYAFGLWYLVQLVAFAGTLFILYRRFRIPIELLPAFGLFAPAAYGPVFGQDPNTVAFLLVAACSLLLDGKERSAGLLLALTSYKFHIVLLLPLLLIFKRRYEALGWMCAGILVLGISSAVLASPSAYLDLLGNLNQYIRGAGDDKSISLRSIAYALGSPIPYYLMAAGVVAMFLLSVRRLPLPEAFSMTVLGSLLVTSHVGGYDAACLLLPIFLAFTSPWRGLQLSAAFMLVLFPIWPGWVNTSLTLVLFMGHVFLDRSGRI